MFLDLGHINLIPFNDPTNQIVHTEDGAAVHSVMVGGRMILEDRKLLNVDMVQLARQAEKARERLDRGRKPAKALYDKLTALVRDGTIHVPVAATYPLTRVNEALAHAARAHRLY